MLPDIGSKVTHTFHISNDGPWHVGEEDVDLLIDWPYQLTPPKIPREEEDDEEGEEVEEEAPRHDRPGKWLLYLASEVEVSPPQAATCFINPRMINPLGLRDRTATPVAPSQTRDQEIRRKVVASLPKRRRRREAREVEEEQMDSSYLSDAVADADVTVNCVNGGARCLVLNCRIWHLKARENVVIR